MKSKIRLVAVSLSLALISLVSVQHVWAQHSHEHKKDAEWETGMLSVSKPVWAGDVRLKSGMYHVKHVVDGNTHFIVFKPVTMPAGKGFPMWEGKEILRLNCRVEPAERAVSNSKMVLGSNSAGEQIIAEIQIAGEKVRHVLLGAAAPSE